MKKYVVLFLLALLVLPVSVKALEVEKIEKTPVVISELNNPAVFDFIITNLGPEENAQIYSLVSVDMYPGSSIKLPNGKSKFEILVNPRDDLRKNLGYIKFEYQIKGEKSGIFKDNLIVKIVPLEDVFDITAEPIKPSDKEATITIINKEKTKIDGVKIKVESPFFEGEKILSFESLSNQTINLEINKDASKIVAGQYIVTAEIGNDKETTTEEGIVDYLEKEGTSYEKKTSGFIIKDTTITKTNKGNTRIPTTISLKKNIISRLFTISSPSPSSVDRNGLFVTYNWESELQPGESFRITSTTNYTIPLILLVLIAFAAFAANVYLKTAVSVDKKVNLLRTRGGEFALKVNLRVKARKNVEDVTLMDTLPGMTKLYEKLGKQPDKVDHGSRRLQWNIGKLSRGQERIYSYVIYSNLKLVGRITLPRAFTSFKSNGRIEQAHSNQAYFATEISRGKTNHN